jgi:hypothetical protein
LTIWNSSAGIVLALMNRQCVASSHSNNYLIGFLFRELIEKLIAPKAQRLNAQEQEDLTILLLEKDDELKKLLKVSLIIYR